MTKQYLSPFLLEALLKGCKLILFFKGNPSGRMVSPYAVENTTLLIGKCSWTLTTPVSVQESLTAIWPSLKNFSVKL